MVVNDSCYKVTFQCFAHLRGSKREKYILRVIQNFRQVKVVNDSCCRVTFQCEDIKTVAQLIQPKDDVATVDIKNGLHHIKMHSLYCPQEPFININYKSH